MTSLGLALELVELKYQPTSDTFALRTLSYLYVHVPSTLVTYLSTGIPYKPPSSRRGGVICPIPERKIILGRRETCVFVSQFPLIPSDGAQRHTYHTRDGTRAKIPPRSALD